MPDVWDRCDLKSQRRSFWTVCCDWFARTITHDHPRSPKTSATSRAISLLFAHDSNIFRSQLGRNMVVSPVWLALKTHCASNCVVYFLTLNTYACIRVVVFIGAHVLWTNISESAIDMVWLNVINTISIWYEYDIQQQSYMFLNVN